MVAGGLFTGRILAYVLSISMPLPPNAIAAGQNVAFPYNLVIYIFTSNLKGFYMFLLVLKSSSAVFV